MFWSNTKITTKHLEPEEETSEEETPEMESSEKKKLEDKNRFSHLPYFPFNPDTRSWSTFNEKIELEVRRLGDLFDINGRLIYGPEAGIMVINQMLKDGWLPPDTTKEQILELYYQANPDKRPKKEENA